MAGRRKYFYLYDLQGGTVERVAPLLGTAVQVEPMKPVLKAPGTKRLMLKCDQPL